MRGVISYAVPLSFFSLPPTTTDGISIANGIIRRAISCSELRDAYGIVKHKAALSKLQTFSVLSIVSYFSLHSQVWI